ncbi:hypothetical protein IKF15_03295 [Candidatus Saccharibacteria bacterium]|nr:hypothetical protein [Candidatus Saccharibacteria bacterium]
MSWVEDAKKLAKNRQEEAKKQLKYEQKTKSFLDHPSKEKADEWHKRGSIAMFAGAGAVVLGILLWIINVMARSPGLTVFATVLFISGIVAIGLMWVFKGIGAYYSRISKRYEKERDKEFFD